METVYMIEAMHNFHPILVHFTIALLVISSILLLVGKIFIDRPWAEKCRSAGNWNMVIGTFSALPTIAAGFYAFATVAHDAPSHLADSYSVGDMELRPASITSMTKADAR